MTGHFEVILQVPVVFEQQAEDARLENEPDAFAIRVPVEVVAEDQHDRTIDGDHDQGMSEMFLTLTTTLSTLEPCNYVSTLNPNLEQIV